MSSSHATAPKVRVEGLHKFFGELHVLKGVDLTSTPIP